MRKSQLRAKPANGNAEKFEKYQEAWARINLARDQGFFFEAVAIQESIISDRLIGYLTELGVLMAVGERREPGFAKLIRSWRDAHPDPIRHGDFEDLQAEVDSWRDSRNRVIHAIVRPQRVAFTVTIDEFLTDAADTADRGVALAKAVQDWTRKTREEIRRRRVIESPEAQPQEDG